MANSRLIKLGAGAVVLVTAVTAIVWEVVKSRSGPYAAKVILVDEETLKEQDATALAVPPLVGAEGRETLVRGSFVTCDGGKTHILVCLSKYTPEGKKKMEEEIRRTKGEVSTDFLRGIRDDFLYRLPQKDSQWQKMSPEFIEQMNKSIQGLGGSAVEYTP